MTPDRHRRRETMTQTRFTRVVVIAVVALASRACVANARVFNFDVVRVNTAPARMVIENAPVTDDAGAGTSDGARGLDLCDCEYATGSSGLECAREGAVIAGFEASGEYAGRGSDESGLVPLSRAICCSHRIYGSYWSYGTYWFNGAYWANWNNRSYGTYRTHRS